MARTRVWLRIRGTVRVEIRVTVEVRVELGVRARVGTCAYHLLSTAADTATKKVNCCR